MPRFSIIMPTYNRAALLPEAIRSVQAQTSADWELIISDDGSTDETAAVAAEFLTDPRIKYYHQPNQGPSAARNAGVAVCSGEVIAFLDSDDKFMPGAVALHQAALEQHPDVGLTIAGCEYVDDAGEHLGWRAPWTEGGDLDLRGWLFNCFAMPGTTAVRREWFERMGGFDRDVRLSEDWHFYMKLATQGCPMAWVREYTVRYRQHSDSLVRNLGRHLEDSLRVLERVLAQPQPEHVRAMGPAARAWAHVVFAGKALAAGQSGLAHRWLREALQLDPSLGNRQRAMLTESLLRPPVDWTRSPIAYGRSVAPHLPPELRLTPLELRRVLARLEMREFFRETDHGRGPEARGHLAAAIRQDPTWLANRGVLAFLARGMQPRLRRA